ncbi:endoplasmic oxidoreductin-1 [Elasticomyces elasticus]|nr:endoplasmic oxidoreductin-1 [Elasticomyces elasticus]
MRISAGPALFLAVYALLGASYVAHAFAEIETQTKSKDSNVCSFEPGAIVTDACASYSSLDNLNTALSPYVSGLTKGTDFFSYYRLNLYNKVCPFWTDESSLCGNRACAVNTLENEEDIPQIWKAAELGRLEGPKAHHPGKKQQRERREKPLLGELGDDVGESCVVEYDDECDERDYCVPEDESASAKGDYVSLVDNPERFTGYGGQGARQVWEAIYRENCFSKPQSGQQSLSLPGISSQLGAVSGRQGQAVQDLRSVIKEHGRQHALETGALDDGLDFEDDCLEKRVFYRVISGMHASISAHLCYDYLNQTTGQWGPNLQCYKERLHNHPERMSNLYFNYALVLRAVGKLRNHVQDYTFCSGDPIEDRKTKGMVTKLAEAIPPGPEIFDESVMFRDNDPSKSGISLKEDFRNRFRNVSRIMDCVGCDKCRLWGKVQTAGFGTALKVLFELGDDDEATKPLLRRTELVALINTLDKIGHSLTAIGEFRKMVEASDGNTVGQKTQVERMTQHQIPEDDGLDGLDGRTEASHQAERTISDEFWEEWYKVWSALAYVLRSWAGLPGKT